MQTHETNWRNADMAKKRKLSPYARIVRNAREGKGVHLTAEEVRQLATDHAIQQVGLDDLEGRRPASRQEESDA